MADPTFVALLRRDLESACVDFHASNDDAVTAAGERYVTRLRIRIDALHHYATACGVDVSDIPPAYGIEMRDA